MANIRILFILIFLFAGSAAVEAQTNIYVDADAISGANDGTSWTDAYLDLQDALDAAVSGDEIWVAEGIYKPSAYPAGCSNCSTNKDYTFLLKEGVELYGGFSGTESPGSFDLNNRDFDANETILSGDLNGDDTVSGSGWTLSIGNNSENVYHVVLAMFSNDVPATKLDGFTISGGNSGNTPKITVNGITQFIKGGGGIYLQRGSNTISNNVITYNAASSSGAGMKIWYGSNTIQDNEISRNWASNNGGGVDVSRGTHTITGNIVSENFSDSRGGGIHTGFSDNTFIGNIISDNAGSRGGGIDSDDSNSLFINNIISGNTSDNSGGGMYLSDSQVTIINNTFWGNSAAVSSGGVYSSQSTVEVTNTIFWDNERNGSKTGSSADIRDTNGVTVRYSLTQSGSSFSSGTGIINNQDPMFTDAAAGDFTLQSNSPVINEGTNSPYNSGGDAESVTTDLAGNDRIYDSGTVDMGAYEFQGDGVISGTASVVITGGAGWRMMGAPITGVTPGDLAGLNLVQGIFGLNYSEFDPNLYVWDPVADTPDFGYSNGAYEVPASGSTELQPGTGFIWYMYGPEANPDVPESKTFPVTIELTGDEPAGDISLGTLEADWHLVANPFLDDINFDEITDGANSALGVAGSVWDPNEGAEGSYVLTTSAAMNNKLSVWQGAFIELSSETEVIIPQSAKTTGASFLKEQPLAGQVEFLLEGLDDNGNVRSIDRAAILYFHQNASAEWDGYDVSKLIPLSESWATMNFVGKKDGELALKSQHSLPYDYADSDVIPIEIQVQNMSGEFRLSWPVIQNLPLVELILEDRSTGKRYDLSQPGSISFSRNVTEKEMSVPGVDSFLKLPELEMKPIKAKTTDPRFAILVNPQDSVFDEIPAEIALNQNYPNPFNPSTVISYQLPASSEVRLDVFDMVGRRIATLVNEQVEAGRHTINFDGTGLSSGIYMYRLQSNGSVFTRKLTLIK